MHELPNDGNPSQESLSIEFKEKAARVHLWNIERLRERIRGFSLSDQEILERHSVTILDLERTVQIIDRDLQVYR